MKKRRLLSLLLALAMGVSPSMTALAESGGMEAALYKQEAAVADVVEQGNSEAAGLEEAETLSNEVGETENSLALEEVQEPEASSNEAQEPGNLSEEVGEPEAPSTEVQEPENPLGEGQEAENPSGEEQEPEKPSEADTGGGR